MHNKKCLLLFIILMLGNPLAARAACLLEIVSAQAFTLSWNTAGLTLQRDVVVKRSGSPLVQCKDFHLAFTTGQSGNINRYLLNTGSQFNYNIYLTAALSSILRDHPSVANANHVINESFSGSSTTKTVSYVANYAIPPYISTIKQGLYTDNVTMKLYRGKWDAPNGVHDTLALSPNLTVPTYIALSLIESGAPFNFSDTYQLLNFGTLSMGQNLGFDIRVEANTSYHVKMSSQNNGKMKRTGGADLIDFMLKVNNVPQNLSTSASTPVIVASHSGTTSQGGFQHPVEVEIGSISGKTAGTYQDTITIETVAQ